MSKNHLPDYVSLSPDQLLAAVRSAYGSKGFSPEHKVCAMMHQCHAHVRLLAGRIVGELLEARQLDALDRIIMHQNIDASAQRWVENARHLTQNTAIREGLIDHMVNVHKFLPVDTELADEVWSILKEPYNRLQQERYQEKLQAMMLAQTQQHLPFGPAAGGPQQQPPVRTGNTPRIP